MGPAIAAKFIVRLDLERSDVKSRSKVLIAIYLG
jgi:hypothetical protein